MRNVAKIGLMMAFLGAVACSKAGPGTVAGAASSAIDVLPKDTQVVFGFNAAKFRESKLWGMVTGMLPAEAKTNLETVKTVCGIDPMVDFESFIVAANGDMSEEKMIFIVKGKWDEDKLNGCVGALGEKMGGKKILVEKDGKLTAYAPEGEKKAWVAWLDKNTMMMTGPSAKGDKASLSDLLAAKSSIKDNKELMGLVGKVDTTATVWAAGWMPDNANLKGMSSQIQSDKKENAQGGWLSLQFGKTLDGNMGLRFDQPANGVVDKVSKELETAKANPQVGKFLSGAKLAAEGNDMVFTIKLDEKQIDEVMGMMQQSLPMLMQLIGG